MARRTTEIFARKKDIIVIIARLTIKDLIKKRRIFGKSLSEYGFEQEIQQVSTQIYVGHNVNTASYDIPRPNTAVMREFSL
jgi:hypothetical protein